MMLSTVSSNPGFVVAMAGLKACTTTVVLVVRTFRSAADTKTSVRAATPQAILEGMGMSIQFGFRRTEPPYPPSTVQNSARFFFHGAASYASAAVDLPRPDVGHRGGGRLRLSVRFRSDRTVAGVQHGTCGRTGR